MTTDIDTQELSEHQQANTIESIIAQEAPGKQGEASVEALTTTLEGMSNDQLLSLLEAAYREDPNANSVVIQKTTSLLQERGAGDAATEKLKAVRSEDWRALLGEKIGGKAWELISEHTGEEQLLEYGKQALDGALDGIVDLIGEIGLDDGGEKALRQYVRFVKLHCHAASQVEP